MRVAYLAAAAALVLSTPAMAAPVDGPASVAHSQRITDTSLLTAVFTNWYSNWTTAFNATFGQKYTGIGQNTTWSATGFNTLDQEFKIVFGNLANASGTYSQSFVWDNVTNTATYRTATPVPGPEAGAGLGALVMGGLALYLKRRRKEVATIA